MLWISGRFFYIYEFVIFRTIREMMAVDCDCGEHGEQLRLSLLIRYFNKVPLAAMQIVPTTSVPVSHGPGAKFLVRAQMNLHYVQCHLDNQGAARYDFT